MKIPSSCSFLALNAVFILVSADSDSGDGEYDANSYGITYADPNVKYDHYYKSSEDVLADLSRFKKLYVKYGGCAWSQSANGGDNCGQSSEDEDTWWIGTKECRESNVAYSLYGVLQDQHLLWGQSGCSKSTFINSFFTLDGLYSFVAASNGQISSNYTSSYCSQYYSGDDDGNSNSGDRRLSGSGDGDDVAYTTLGCSATGNFTQDLFLSAYCNGAAYNETLDPLDEFNLSLEDMGCQLIYSSKIDYASQLLYYSQVCSIMGEYKYFCPDPHGIIMTYEYSLAIAQVYPNYEVNQDENYGYFQNDWSDHSDVIVVKKVFGSFFFFTGTIFIIGALTLRYRRKRPRKFDYNENAVIA